MNVRKVSAFANTFTEKRLSQGNSLMFTVLSFTNPTTVSQHLRTCARKMRSQKQRMREHVHRKPTCQIRAQKRCSHIRGNCEHVRKKHISRMTNLRTVRRSALSRMTKPRTVRSFAHSRLPKPRTKASLPASLVVICLRKRSLCERV
jgi:hypothetical protein